MVKKLSVIKTKNFTKAYFVQGRRFEEYYETRKEKAKRRLNSLLPKTGSGEKPINGRGQ